MSKTPSKVTLTGSDDEYEYVGKSEGGAITYFRDKNGHIGHTATPMAQVTEWHDATHLSMAEKLDLAIEVINSIRASASAGEAHDLYWELPTLLEKAAPIIPDIAQEVRQRQIDDILDRLTVDEITIIRDYIKEHEEA